MTLRSILAKDGESKLRRQSAEHESQFSFSPPTSWLLNSFEKRNCHRSLRPQMQMGQRSFASTVATFIYQESLSASCSISSSTSPKSRSNRFLRLHGNPSTKNSAEQWRRFWERS